MELSDKIEEAVNTIKLNNANCPGKTILTTSCGATSALLIDLVSRSECGIPVVFIDTGFMFKETVAFFYELKKRYMNLFFIRLKNENSKEEFYVTEGSAKKIVDTDRCCNENKVKVLNSYIEENTIQCWISALRREQTHFRSRLGKYQRTPQGVLKLFPVIDWTEKEIREYMTCFDLP